MRNKLNPLAGIESGAIKAAKDMERMTNPLAGIESAALRASTGMDRMFQPIAGMDSLGMGKLHRSMADHMSIMTGGDAFKAHLGAINATRPLIDAMDPFSKTLVAPSKIYDLHRGVTAQFVDGGLDDIRRGVTGILGNGEAMASLDAFAKLRDQLGGSLGRDVATRWDRLAAATALPSVAALSYSFERPTAVMTLATTDDVLGTLAWLEPPLDENDAPRVVVAAIHSEKPAGPLAWRELKIATGSAINCSESGEPFDLNLMLWLTSEDAEVFFQGELFPTCGECLGEGDLLPDLSRKPRYRMIDGGGTGDGKATGKLASVVDNTTEDDDD